uniref:Dolichyl-P-Glc:Glc(2)Man(9)GlcNAc(2)-PP-dolichol alpha-1,2-glucosyltransferase n=1 Tax=Elaeophora elaphi TaxID=1147741 RepID=A0A0R3RMS7_9BILA
VRRCLRWRFQGNQFLQHFYDLLTFATTKITLSYATYPFVMLHLGPGLYFYRQMYFCLHFTAFFAIFLLPRILPPESKLIQTEKIGDMKKSSLYSQFFGYNDSVRCDICKYYFSTIRKILLPVRLLITLIAQ